MTRNFSKTNMIAGRQCPKRLYLAIHKPTVAQYSESVKRLFDRGQEANSANLRIGLSDRTSAE